MNGYVHGAVLKLDLLLLPLHWKKRLPKAAGPMSGAEAKSFLLSVWIKLGKHLRKQNTTEEAESLVSVPSVEERREVLTGAAGMIARGRSLFPWLTDFLFSVSRRKPWDTVPEYF